MPDDKKIRTSDYDPENPRCDRDQLKFLKDCIAKGPKGIEKWNQWRRENEDIKIWLQKAKLSDAHLEKAYLRDAHLEGAYLWGAHLENAHLLAAHLEGAELTEVHLEGAILIEAHLEGAKLLEAHLERADLYNAHLEGAELTEVHLEGAKLSDTDLRAANFRKAIVDGETLIWSCKVNKWKQEKWYTDFAGVGLESMRIQPGLKQLLEYNIRRSNWHRWYKKHPIIKCLVWPFWQISDYGLSTTRIIVIFFGLAFAFASVYYWGGVVDFYLLGNKTNPGFVDSLFVVGDRLVPWWQVPLRSIYFSIVTMTTLGFGDMHANPFGTLIIPLIGYVLLIIQVLLGYVLLGALVTRLAFLFNAGGPSEKFEPMTKVTEQLIEKKGSRSKSG